MSHFEKVLKDPVHDEILVDDPWMWRIVNTAAVQRLRRIRQLGTSYLTFHGAEHSRFTHSLGAYETMRRVLIHLQSDSGWPLHERDKRLALASAVLHDVGHGPFSHTFESVYPVHHEQWTQRIILEDDELRSVLDEIDSDFATDLTLILRKSGRFPVIEQLITSQLDVDRMDYLLRDALNTGVSYGRFELARLIRSLTLCDGQVVLHANALHTVEQYILARYFMYTQVYLHPVTVGSDVLVLQILRRAGELLRSGVMAQMPAELAVMIGTDQPVPTCGSAPFGAVAVAQYLAIDESTLLYAFRQWSTNTDAVLADLATRFLHRKLFTPIVHAPPTPSEWASLRTAARALGFHPDYYVCGRASEVAGYVYRGEGIRVQDHQGALIELSRASKLVRALQADSEYRLFLPREMWDADDPMADRVRSLIGLS